MRPADIAERRTNCSERREDRTGLATGRRWVVLGDNGRLVTLGRATERLPELRRACAFRFGGLARHHDILGYAKRLRDTGVSMEQAEAHAAAARDFMLTELATKPDLIAVRQDMAVMRSEIQTAMDNLTLRLTVRLGSMLALSAAILAAVIKL